MELIDHTSKACDDKMSMLDGEEIGSPPKKSKSIGNYGNANETGGVVQNNCAVMNTIGSTIGSVGESLRLAGITKVDE